MSQAVLYDATRCIGCRACQVACKQWNEMPGEKTINSGTYENPPHLSSRTLTRLDFHEIEDKGSFHWVFTKQQCMHCEHPACAQACIVGALRKTPDGPVIYDENRCIGCRYCMVACPFGVPAFEWDKPVPWIRKCTFCADRQSAGLEPACVATCPSGALKFGQRKALIAEAHERIAASPGEYVDHVYGENEVGGTSWLYLSPVPFEKLGFPVLGTTPVTINVERAMGAVPPALIAVATGMAGIYWLVRRRERLSQERDRQKKVRVAR